MERKFKEFKPTSWSIDNKTSIYVLAIIISIFGIISYNGIPKEQFPEIVIPTIAVNTVYPGTSPTDMENLVTRPIEKNIKSLSGVKKITSNSVQDFSSIMVEFNTDVDVADAKQKVKDAVDKSKNTLPNNLPQQPIVAEVDFSEFPIMFINVAGNYDLDRLKQYAEQLQDRIESLKEITRCDIVGALGREIKIDVDMYKMQAAAITFGDIERAVAYENMTISGGSLDMSGMRRSVRVVGEFENIEQIKNIVMKSSSGALVSLRDIADIKDSYLERENYSRFNEKNVITLNIVKKSGQNLLDAADKIKDIIDDLKIKKFPSDLQVSITGDQSKFTRNTLHELNNTIIIGFVLVVIILMFFMGLINALFVGLSVPLSMALAYIVMPGIDFTMNMLTMFAFIFSLGIVVDDAIVVVENTYRIFKKSGLPIKQSAKIAAGQVFMPILSGTVTTIAPFLPLAFWPGTIGKFMFYIPVTLIITLLASLFVAYIINPIFTVDFMRSEDETKPDRKQIFKVFKIFLIIQAISIPFYFTYSFGIANFITFIALSYLGHNLIGYRVLAKFQHKIIPSIMNKYERLLHWVLVGKRPVIILILTVVLLVMSFVITGIVKPAVVFFPNSEPNQLNIFIKMPIGTDVKYTDSIARVVENKAYNVLGKNNKDIESVITNVAKSASENSFDNFTVASHLAKISINFVEFQYRVGPKTATDFLDDLREVVKTIAGAEITVEKVKMGPPVGKPISVEVSGEDIDELVKVAFDLRKVIKNKNIPGVEELKADFDISKPEILIDIDRKRANHEGISTAQIGGEIRTAIFGKEVSKYRDGEDQYPIQVRYTEDVRKNIDKLMDMKITYRDMTTGLLRQIPLSSVATIKYTQTYGGIKRKNLKRVITLFSDVSTGFTTNEVLPKIQDILDEYDKPESVDMKITGEMEDQAETGRFLSAAMLLSLCLILFIMITQFNSISKPLIIITEVLFSIAGVLLGFSFTGMSISIIMTGLGIVALAGIVVRNGILLVEFTDVLLEKGIRPRQAIIRAGKTRITPVLLTAIATILGLLPLAIGLNINFATLFSELNPQIHFGGDTSAFFGPLAWTIIYGLTYATFLTLVIIPIMYYLMYAAKTGVKKWRKKHVGKKEQESNVLNEDWDE